MLDNRTISTTGISSGVRTKLRRILGIVSKSEIIRALEKERLRVWLQATNMESGRSRSQGPVKLDLLDLSILEKLLYDAQTTFKELAKETNTDQRTIALRFRRMLKQGVIRRVTIDVDWSKVGLGVTALMGSITSEGVGERNKLLGLIRDEPRILEAFTTMGSHEYFIRAVGVDIASIRREISSPLEPLTSKLDTSVVVESIKTPNYKGLMNYLRGEKGERTESIQVAVR